MTGNESKDGAQRKTATAGGSGNSIGGKSKSDYDNSTAQSGDSVLHHLKALCEDASQLRDIWSTILLSDLTVCAFLLFLRY